MSATIIKCLCYHDIDHHDHVFSLQWQLLAAVTLDIVGTVAFCKVPFIIISLIITITSLIIIIITIRWSGRATMERFQDL